MTLNIKKTVVFWVAISMIAGVFIVPADVFANYLCKDSNGYIYRCANQVPNTGGGSTSGSTGGTVAGVNTLGGVNSQVCAFNQAATTITGITDGALIRAQGDIDIYIVKYVCNEKFKRLILSPHVFDSYGHFNWNDVQTVNKTTLDSFTTSNFVRATSAGDPKVYMLVPKGDTGTKRWITSESVFLNNDWDWDAIYTINTTDRDAYATGISITQ
ncbi:MAG: hypothetical protein WDZ40_02405 [Candidatus Spechtbacterales bacterium]